MSEVGDLPGIFFYFLRSLTVHSLALREVKVEICISGISIHNIGSLLSFLELGPGGGQSYQNSPTTKELPDGFEWGPEMKINRPNLA